MQKGFYWETEDMRYMSSGVTKICAGLGMKVGGGPGTDMLMWQFHYFPKTANGDIPEPLRNMLPARHFIEW